MTDTTRDIRGEVMTLEMQGSTWVLAEDYCALLARAEAAEAERDALEALVRQAINEDDGRYFEVNPFHVQALRALGDDEHLDPLDQPKKGKDDE